MSCSTLSMTTGLSKAVKKINSTGVGYKKCERCAGRPSTVTNYSLDDGDCRASLPSPQHASHHTTLVGNAGQRIASPVQCMHGTTTKHREVWYSTLPKGRALTRFDYKKKHSARVSLRYKKITDRGYQRLGTA